MAAKSTKTGKTTKARKRGPGRPFQKGKSGNPSGRPKRDPDLALRAKEMTSKIMDKLEAIVDLDIGKVSEPKWLGPILKACEIVLAYGHGKPVANVHVTRENLAALSDDELMAGLPEAIELINDQLGEGTVH